MFIRTKTAFSRASSPGNRERFTLNIFRCNIKMPVDKFGRIKPRQIQRHVQGPAKETSSAVPPARMNDIFLRRDGTIIRSSER